MDLSCLGRTIYARHFWVLSNRFNSATGEQKGITQTIYTDSEPPSRTSNSLMPSAKLRSANLPFFYVFGVTRSGIEPRPPAPRADALTTMLRGGGCKLWGSYIFGPWSSQVHTSNDRTRKHYLPFCLTLVDTIYPSV